MEASTVLEVPLRKLPDCFNSVVCLCKDRGTVMIGSELTCLQLIQIGKVFRETSQRDAKVASYVSKAQSPEIIIRANDRFHEALDDVEIQLVSPLELSSCVYLVDRRLNFRSLIAASISVLFSCKSFVRVTYPPLKHLCLRLFCSYLVRLCRHIGLDQSHFRCDW